MAPSDLGEALSAVRLSAPEAQQQMQLSLSRLGQLTPVQAFRAGGGAFAYVAVAAVARDS